MASLEDCIVACKITQADGFVQKCWTSRYSNIRQRTFPVDRGAAHRSCLAEKSENLDLDD